MTSSMGLNERIGEDGGGKGPILKLKKPSLKFQKMATVQEMEEGLLSSQDYYDSDLELEPVHKSVGGIGSVEAEASSSSSTSSLERKHEREEKYSVGVRDGRLVEDGRSVEADVQKE